MKSLVEAQTDGRVLPRVDVELPLDRAYAVQRQVRSARVAAGDRVAGYKIGLSSTAARGPWDAGEPVSGHLLGSTVVEVDLAAYSLANLSNPHVETEIAFTLHSPLSGDDVSLAEVIAATSHLTIALEIVASRWAGGHSSLGLLVADNVNAAGVVLGPRAASTSDLDDLAVTIDVAGTLTHGSGSQV